MNGVTQRIPATRIEFIESLALSPNGKRILSAPTTSGIESIGSVDAGSVISFLPQVSLQHQQDVLYSTLLAQLAANKAVDRFTDSSEWYTCYLSVLENLGWTVLEISFLHVDFTQRKIRMDEVSLSQMELELSGSELSAVDNSLEILGEASEDSEETLVFDQSSSTENAGNFQLSVASSTQSENVSLVLAAFYFQAKTVMQPKFLFASHVSKDVNFYAGVHRLVLNESIYANARQAVIDKLGTNIDSLIVPLS